MKRRRFSMLLLTAALVGVSAATHADAVAEFPNRPIKIIVPFPAGGTADVLPRIIGQKLNEKWGQAVIVENRTGAGGNIGADAVAKAEPDGYTLLSTPPGPLVINQSLYRSLAFDPTKFVPVTVLAAVPNVLAVRTTLPVNSAREFIEHARKNPGKLNVATQGDGTTSHLTGALFASQADVQFTFVPYKGTAPAITDLVGGQVDAFFDNIASMASQHKAGKAKILAVTSKKRSALLPDIPTLAESELPNFDVATWFGVVAPAGTPPAIVEKINTAIKEALKMPDVQQKFQDQGAEIVGNSPKEMAKFMDDERARWKKVIESAGVTLN